MQYAYCANVYGDGTLQITTGIGKGTPDFKGDTYTWRSWNGSMGEPTTRALLLGGALILSGVRRRAARLTPKTVNKKTGSACADPVVVCC